MKVGRFVVRSQFEDQGAAEELFQQFIPSVLYNIFKLKSFNLKTDDLPLINGVGFRYKKAMLTAFAEKRQLLFLDSAGLDVMAKTLDKKAPEKEE